MSYTALLHGGKAEMVVDRSDAEPQPRAGEIGLRLPAEVEQLAMLRAVAETVLLTADFTVDVVTDLRVAIDEVATALIVSAIEGATIDCEFNYDAREVSIRVASIAEVEGALGENSVGWHVLDTLTDSIETTRDEFDAVCGGYPIVVHFRRLRSEDDDG
ncbi:anti-sigma factor [Nocardia sp. NPDC051030]|uniref:ATP-binding protein n=1 Tax=Nocardia sp. NPDC051030 TaxID=3155162 RepID=UPI003437272C